MKTNKTSLYLLISLLGFLIISILAIYSTKIYLKPNLSNLYLKQLLFYIIGIIILLFTKYKGFKFLKKYHLIIYIGINILLLFLLLYGININGSRCWIILGPINFQPSELMKISLIITLAKTIDNYNKNKNKTRKEEFILLLKLFIITLIPSILTFLEPDTGVVIIYLLIFITMLFFIKINKIWHITFISLIFFIIGTISFLYFFKQDLFINLVGNNIFYRIDRLLNWINIKGYQLENSLIAIGSSGLLGFGFLKNPVYFPEPQTDFIFTTITANFGLIGSYFLIFLIIIFDLSIINLTFKKIKTIDKYIIIGTFIVLFYGQIQNIGMTLGLLPITGIPLPYISYGGSSLISYLFSLGIISNINYNLIKYHN